MIARSGIRRNTFFVKMRGETALTTDDISKLASALGVEPEVIFTRAAGERTAPVTELRPRADVGGNREDLPAAARKADPDRGEDQ